MSPQPLLSVVIVVFREREELRQILTNLSSFACPELEVVVVDGASGDGTAEMLQQFIPAPAFWCSEPDRGIYDAMNKALAKASGTYVLHLNAGDRLLEVPWDTLRKASENKVDVVCSCVQLDHGRVFVSRTSTLSKMDNTWHHQGTFYRRESHLGYDLSYRTHADFDHNQRLMLAGARVIQDGTLVASHRNDGVTAEGTSHKETLLIVGKHFGWAWQMLAKLRLVLLDKRRAWRQKRAQG